MSDLTKLSDCLATGFLRDLFELSDCKYWPSEGSNGAEWLSGSSRWCGQVHGENHGQAGGRILVARTGQGWRIAWTPTNKNKININRQWSGSAYVVMRIQILIPHQPLWGCRSRKQNRSERERKFCYAMFTWKILDILFVFQWLFIVLLLIFLILNLNLCFQHLFC